MNLVTKVKEVEAIQYESETYLDIKKRLIEKNIEYELNSNGLYIYRPFDTLFERLDLPDFDYNKCATDLIFIMKFDDWIVFTDDRLGFRIYTSKEEMLKYYDIN
jgi:hypothetical protein